MAGGRGRQAARPGGSVSSIGRVGCGRWRLEAAAHRALSAHLPVIGSPTWGRGCVALGRQWVIYVVNYRVYVHVYAKGSDIDVSML